KEHVVDGGRRELPVRERARRQNEGRGRGAGGRGGREAEREHLVRDALGEQMPPGDREERTEEADGLRPAGGRDEAQADGAADDRRLREREVERGPLRGAAGEQEQHLEGERDEEEPAA